METIPVRSSATSARLDLPEAAISFDRSRQQLLLLLSIAGRTEITLLAAFRRQRSGTKAAEALQIAKIAQYALEALCRSVHSPEFTVHGYRNNVRQHFQHVPQTFRLDP